MPVAFPASPWRHSRLLGGTLAVSVLLFIAVTADVIIGGLLVRLDRVFVEALAPFDARALGRTLSSTASRGTIAGVMLLGALLALALGRRSNAAFILLFTVVGAGVQTLLKITISRVRPIADPLSSAYPSGHAALAVLAYGLTLFLVTDAVMGRIGHRRALPAVAVTAWAAISLLAGAGRVLAGLHWPTDVLGGWLLGLAVLAAGLLAWNASRDQSW